MLFSYNFAQDLLIVIVTSQSSYVPRQIKNYFNERGGITFCKLLVYSVGSQKNLILDFEMAKRKRIVLSIEEKLKVCEMFRNKIPKTDIMLKYS